MRLLAVAVFFLLTPHAVAQSDWRIEHKRIFGGWESVCDTRELADALQQRCYVRFIDRVSPPPIPVILFLVATLDDRLQFGFEKGTRFDQDGIRLERDGRTLWIMEPLPCLTGSGCMFSKASARAILEHMDAADRMRLDFTDPHGISRRLIWDMNDFSEALSDLRSASDDGKP